MLDTTSETIRFYTGFYGLTAFCAAVVLCLLRSACGECCCCAPRLKFTVLPRPSESPLCSRTDGSKYTSDLPVMHTTSMAFVDVSIIWSESRALALGRTRCRDGPKLVHTGWCCRARRAPFPRGQCFRAASLLADLSIGVNAAATTIDGNAL